MVELSNRGIDTACMHQFFLRARHGLNSYPNQLLAPAHTSRCTRANTNTNTTEHDCCSELRGISSAKPHRQRHPLTVCTAANLKDGQTGSSVLEVPNRRAVGSVRMQLHYCSCGVVVGDGPSVGATRWQF